MDESAINTPHPDEPDEADLFFGGDEDDAETAPAPEFDPVSQTLTPGVPNAEDPTPAEQDGTTGSTGEPDPTVQEPAGTSEASTEDPPPAAETVAADAPASESGPETPAEPDPTPVSVETPSPASETPAASEPDPTPASSTDAEASRGALEREYLVFHKQPLTEKALRYLLAEIEEGRAPEPRVAYFQIHQTTTRNVKSAVADAYTTHRAQLGESVDLAAVSERAFQHRHVEPTRVVEAALSIT